MEVIMIRPVLCILALVPAPAVAQTAGTQPAETPPVTVTTVDPVVPPSSVVTPVAPNTVAVTRVPGIAAVSTTKIQSFADYDIDDNGSYSPMEFAQAMAFLAGGKPATGAAALPATDKHVHKGTLAKMPPARATAWLNATSEEFAQVDANNDWRVSQQELAAAAML
jgi:hypothetical protein